MYSRKLKKNNLGEQEQNNLLVSAGKRKDIYGAWVCLSPYSTLSQKHSLKPIFIIYWNLTYRFLNSFFVQKMNVIPECKKMVHQMD